MKIRKGLYIEQNSKTYPLERPNYRTNLLVFSLKISHSLIYPLLLGLKKREHISIDRNLNLGSFRAPTSNAIFELRLTNKKSKFQNHDIICIITVKLSGSKFLQAFHNNKKTVIVWIEINQFEVHTHCCSLLQILVCGIYLNSDP